MDSSISSYFLSKSMGRNHHSVVQLIKKHEKTLSKLGQLKKENVKTKGRSIISYSLSYCQTAYLFSAFSNSKSVSKVKEVIFRNLKLNHDFNEKIKTALSNFDFDGLNDRYIYIASNESGQIKIGISKNPEKRVKQLNIGNHEILKLIYFYKSEQKGYSEEKMIHKQMSNHKIRSEWFNNDCLKEISIKHNLEV